MIISDTSCMIDVFTIALLTVEFGQVWEKLGLRELHDCTIVQLPFDQSCLT